MGEQFRFYRFYYSLFGATGFMAMIFYLVQLPSRALFEPGSGSRIAGSVISLIGFVIMAICIVKYFSQMSGIKGWIEINATNKLMITGIHKMVRHPLYSGTFIFIWGLLLLFPGMSLLISDLIITIYTLIGVRLEEQKLEKEFGEAYKLYKREVPMLIPKLRIAGSVLQ